MFSESDLSQFKCRGISPATVEAQLKRFATGFPYLGIDSAATPGHGITVLSLAEADSAIVRWRQYLSSGGEVMKFVPASGAASRMFKDLFAFADGDTDDAPQGSAVARLLADPSRLPFIGELNDACKRLYGSDVASLLEAHRSRDVVKAIITRDGMGYGYMPKALLTFHAYPETGETRTALEEQLMEGAQTAASAGKVYVHFTVSAEHRDLFAKTLGNVLPVVEARTGLKYVVDMSEQKPATDTVAVDADGNAFRRADGTILFRPGGHGALIANLDDIKSAVVFIKNIDNVVPDSRRADTIRFKQVLGGVLMLARDKMSEYIMKIDEGLYTQADLDEIVAFMRNTLCIESTMFDSLNEAELADYLRAKLDRPLRVCGMVRNEGEPGGGPFLAVNPDGTVSPQILETSQIAPENKSMMQTATHFNPVDLVCYVKDYKGNAYELAKYVDPATGFISSKSLDGRPLRALELPGLWNGAMSDWNTIFVEVPESTFNPVKTVNDLLRPAHQPATDA